jgi:uncharacterized protein YukE
VSGLIGGDVDQLQQLGDQLKLKQGDIDQIINAIRTALGSTVWQGPARDRFEGEWRSSFEPALGRMKEAFDAAGTECKSRAAALHAAMAQ